MSNLAFTESSDLAEMKEEIETEKIGKCYPRCQMEGTASGAISEKNI